jgi:RNA polymerase sigma-70 factor (ECF subfamily)
MNLSSDDPRAPLANSTVYGTLPDATLVQRTQAGDTRAFDELVRRYRDKVYRLGFKILRHEDDAAEALQDAFLSAYRGLKNFKAESTFSTWLYRITTNAALMKYRKRREGHISLEQSQSRDDDAQPMELADWSAIPDEELEDRETWEVLMEAVDRLPEDLRVVFYRRDWLEESNADVADSLGLTVAAVKSRLHRARMQLRERLNRHFAGKLSRPGRAGGRRDPEDGESPRADGAGSAISPREEDAGR